MKSKACTRCRQWKVRCDAEHCLQMGCTRCRSLKVKCVVDPSFKRVSTSKRWQQMHSELTQLKQAQQAQSVLPIPESSLSASQSRDETMHQNTSIQNCTVASSSIGQPSHLPAFVAGPFLGPANASTLQAASTPTPERLAMPSFAQGTGSRYEKSIGDIRLTAGQITELFKCYRASHHRFLPFTMHESSEVIYTKSPLLFWVICAVASSNRLKPRFAPHIRNLVAEILTTPARSVETVQALLIMCMWPFNFSKLVNDASFFYSCLATQIGLQLGLHRPSLTHTHLGSSEQQDAETDFDSRLTTWLACFVVNEAQSSFRGVPPSIQVDFSLISSLNHRKVDPTLARLCYISRLHIQSSLVIGARAENISGLLDPSSRTTMITLFGDQYAVLLRDRLHPMDNITEHSFLSSRIQLWSFALLDDMPFTTDLFEIYHQAEKDAIRLIQLGCERNLTSVPCHVTHSVIYSAIVLIKILKSTYTMQHESILDHIHRARQALSSAITAENDVVWKACQILQNLPLVQDQKLTPQIFSRMTASIFYDSLRICAEHKYHMLSLAQQPTEIDLNGFDWDSFKL